MNKTLCVPCVADDTRNQARRDRHGILRAAETLGVEHVVKLSALGASDHSKSCIARDHASMPLSNLPSKTHEYPISTLVTSPLSRQRRCYIRRSLQVTVTPGNSEGRSTSTHAGEGF